MFTRVSRSWELVKASGMVLRQDKELMVFPFLSAIATVVVAVSFLVPLIASGGFAGIETHSSQREMLGVVAFLFYLCCYFVMFFFNAALVGAAMIRLEGGDPTVGDGLRIAASKTLPILGYAAIAATVGLILRAIEERAGFIGKWIAGLLGVAFSIATFLAVPILVSRDVGPLEAVKESASTLKQTWGENIVGNSGIGLIFFLCYFVLGLVGLGVCVVAVKSGVSPVMYVAFAAMALAFIALALIHAALQGVYSAALYRYATTGEGGSSFHGELMNGAFRSKG